MSKMKMKSYGKSRNKWDEEEPLKVHLRHDQEGAVTRMGRPFSDTLCKSNSNVPSNRITTDPNRVTCILCRRAAKLNRTLNQLNPALLISRGAEHRAKISPEHKIESDEENKPRTRFRSTWDGKLVLQIKEKGKIVWRDAKLTDLTLKGIEL